MALFLREADVERLLTMPMALAAVEEAFGLLGAGQADNQPRQRVHVPGVMLHLMGAGIPADGLLGFKAYTTTASGARFHLFLYDAQSGALEAIMEADRLGQMRTGAASGVATRYLARPDAAEVGLIGAGWQAESQLLAMAAVRPIARVRVFAPRAERVRAFCERMAPLLGVPVEPAGDAEAAARPADIVVTATTARDPVLRGEWLRPGTHVNAVGANVLSRREVDDETIRRAGRLVVDSVEQAKRESADLVEPIARGVCSWEDVEELAAIVVGAAPGRQDAEAITLFKSNGLALEDVAAGARVLEAARRDGVGETLAV